MLAIFFCSYEFFDVKWAYSCGSYIKIEIEYVINSLVTDGISYLCLFFNVSTDICNVPNA